MKLAILSSKMRLKKPKGNIHFGKIFLVLMLISFIFLNNFNFVFAEEKIITKTSIYWDFLGQSIYSPGIETKDGLVRGYVYKDGNNIYPGGQEFTGWVPVRVGATYRALTQRSSSSEYIYLVLMEDYVPQPPTLIISTPSENSYFGKNKTINLSGTVNDLDSSQNVTISATINGKTKTTTVTTPSNNKAWSLSWSSDELADGTYTNVVVTANDGNGGADSKTFTGKIIVDKTNPTVPTLTVNENWSKDNVTATIVHGTDGGSGVARTEYSLSGATTKTWTTYSSGVVISNEGSTTIKARTIDTAGNISNEVSKTVRIDRTPAVTSVPKVIPKSATEIEVEGNPNDVLSGLHNQFILWNRDNVDIGSWSNQKVLLDKNLEPNSKHIYKYKAKDKLENISNYSEEILVYTLALYPEKIRLDDYTVEKALFKIFTNEENKEIAENQIIIKEKGKTDIVVKSDWTKEEEVLINGLSSDKKYEIYINTRNGDKVETGEMKLSSTSNPPLVDSNGDSIDDFDTSEEEVNPVITILPYETEWTTEDIEVKATTNKGTLNKDSHIFTENGSFTFIAETTLENRTEKEVVISNIDKMIPEIEINYNEDPTIEDLKISVDVKVGGSGIQSKKWDKGERDISYFDTNGNVLEDTFLIDDNGLITVYVKNGANVEVVKTIEITNAFKQIYENAKLAVDKAVETNEDSDIDLAQEKVDKIPDIFVAEKDALQTILDVLKSIKIVEDIDPVRDIKDIINTKLDSYKYQNKLLEYLDDRIVVITDDKLEILENMIDEFLTYNQEKYKDIIDYANVIQDYINEITDIDKKQLRQEKLDELLKRLKGKLKDIIDEKLDELEDLIDEAEDKKIKDSLEYILDKIEEIEDLIDKSKEMGEDTTEQEERLEEIKDRLDKLKELIDVILNLEDARFDLESNPASLILIKFEESLEYDKYYKYIVKDLETDTIIAEGITKGGIVELSPVFEGHIYRAEIEAYLNDGKVAEKTLEETKTDKIEPELKYAYMLDGVLTVYATDNYKLHQKPYAFRILEENEKVEVIKNTVIDTEFGTMAWIVNDNEKITNINYDSSNKQNIPSPYPKTVTVRIRDFFGNVNTKTFNITKENESIYGDIPQDIVDQINKNNKPPAVENGNNNNNNDNYSDQNNDSGEKKDSSIIIDNKLPEEIIKEIEGVLDNNNLEVNPIDTESNSQEGGFTINIKKELDKLNDLVKKHLGLNENTLYRITITEKDTNRLVYTKTSKDRENLIIPDLHDSTIYNIKISLIINGKELAFKEIEKMTYDKTPPIIEKILVKNNTVEIVATDNIKLHNKAYQYTINSTGRIAFGNNDLGDLEILILASNFDTNVWTEKSRLTDLDVGEKVTVIVRDHSENYTVTEFEVQDGLVLDSVNSDNPLKINKNSEISVEELMKKILETYNKKNPDNQYDMNKFNKDNFTISSSNPNVVYFENDKLIAKNPGTVIITLTDKTTGQSYRYLIVVSKHIAFDRRIVVQTNSETDLSRVFEEQLYKHFGGTPISLFIKERQTYGELDINIFKSYDTEGIVTIIATDGTKDIPFYAIVVDDQYPTSDVEVILTNIPHVVKKEDIIDIKQVSSFYNELYEEVDTDYLIVEVNNILNIDEGKIYALDEGIGVVNIIDLANNRVEEIDFRVINNSKGIESNVEEVPNIQKHWAKDNIIDLANKNILDIDSKFNPEENVTVEEFLTAISRTKVAFKNSSFERRNKLNLDNLVDENRHYILDSLNDFTMFGIEYTFNDKFDLSKNITREEIAVYLSLAFDLKSNSKMEFKDVALSTRKKEIQAVKDYGIMVGRSKNTFEPTKHLTKAELATIIKNIYGHKQINSTK